MNNPIGTALRGKGIKTMLSRVGSLINRYGFSDKKMNSQLTQLINILEEYSCQATLPVTATALARHKTLAQKIQSRGIELAVHGYTHIDYSQLSLEQQISHFQQARQIFEQAGVNVAGFRSPYLRSNSDTILALKECGFSYDSSPALVWDVAKEWESDSFRHVISFYGAASASRFPSIPKLNNGVVQLPYSLPDDEALVERFKLTNPTDMNHIWLAMLEEIYQVGELFVVGLHPERVSLCQEPLRALLRKARQLSPYVWIARLDEITEWYLALGEAIVMAQKKSDGGLQINIQAPSRAVILFRSIDIHSPNKPWANGYQQILSNEFTIPDKGKPWIGLSPQRPESLELFLRHQGFLTEISSEPAQFSYYFNQTTFQPDDERIILTALEDETKPLLRLGRWPEGAQAALAVTGDVDAFTLWDYGMRIVNR